MLLIIDNQSTFIKKFKRNFLDEQDFEYRFFDHNQHIQLDEDEQVHGIILSGGKGNPYEPLNLTANFVALNNFDVPIMGLCLGFEIIAVAHGGRIKKLENYRHLKDKIFLNRLNDPIFDGFKKKEITLQEKHSFYVSDMPKNFECLAYSNTCKYEIIKHNTLPIYGFQAHPENSDAEGLQIMKNFFKICGLL